MPKPRAAAITGLAALTLGLAACGTGTLDSQTSGQSATPKAAVLAAVSQMKSSSYRFAMRLVISGLGQATSSLGGSGGASSETITGAGAYSAPQQAVEMTLNTGLAGSASTSTVDEIVFERTGKAYMRVAGGALADKWYQLDVGSLGQLQSMFSSLGGGPGAYLGGVSDAIVSVQRVGTAEVAGVATTEYAVTENLHAYLSKVLGSNVLSGLFSSLLSGSGMTSAEKSAMTNAINAALAAMPQEMTLDTWLDGAGHLRRMTVTLPLGALMSAMFSALSKSVGAGMTGVTGGSLSMIDSAFAHMSETMTLVVTQVGGAVDIVAPAASQILPGSPLISSSASASGSASASASATTSTSPAG